MAAEADTKLGDKKEKKTPWSPSWLESSYTALFPKWLSVADE